MSLQIYYEGVDVIPSGISVARDVEYLFESVTLDGSSYDRAIIASIENGKYVDDVRFEDRFGVALYLKHMSTGAKAALSVYHMPDTVVWCGEVVCNAITEIVKNCTRGSILLRADCHFVFGAVEDIKIDVVCRGKHYSSLDELAEYMFEEAPE